MNKIDLPSQNQDWFGISLYPNKEFIENLRGKATVNTILGDKNEIYFGKPYIKKIDTPLHQNKSLSEDLFLVHFSVSFRPALECEFVSATIQVSIKDDLKKNDTSAVIMDLFPVNIFMPITFKRTISISPQLKFDLSKVAQIEASALKSENSKEYIIYQPSLTAFGKGTNIAGWDFEKSTSRGIVGIKDLFLLIKRTELSPLRLSFELRNCYVQMNIGKIPLSTMLLSGSEEKILEDKYIIIG